MHTIALSQNRPAWTWADLLSTYRFWGLFLWFVLTAAGMQSRNMFLFFHLTDRLGLTPSSAGTVMLIAQSAALLFALILAWAAIRTRPVVTLLITSGLVALAAIAFTASWSREVVAMATVAMLICLSVGSYVATLLFPTLIAGALGGYEAFFVAFGVSFFFQYAMDAAISAAYSGVSYVRTSGVLESSAYVSAGLLLAAVICLIPIKHSLFTVEPPPRGRSFAPKYREVFLTALLTAIVPFYVLYWLYQAHGEAAHLRPSRALLSPRGAAWIAAIPLLGAVMFPFMLTTLADHLNLRAAELGLPRVCRPWAVFLWTLLFAPVAVGVLQSGLNGLAARTAQPAPAA
jgi:hypothetical protein